MIHPLSCISQVWNRAPSLLDDESTGAVAVAVSPQCAYALAWPGLAGSQMGAMGAMKFGSSLESNKAMGLKMIKIYQDAGKKRNILTATPGFFRLADHQGPMANFLDYFNGLPLKMAQSKQLIYPLNMVMFHRFLYVYLRVPDLRISSNGQLPNPGCWGFR